MKADRLLRYKNWSIKIQSEEHQDDGCRTTFSAIAIVIYEGRNPAFETQSSECFIASLPCAAFHHSADAELAILQEARRRINALPIHLPAALESFRHCSRSK